MNSRLKRSADLQDKDRPLLDLVSCPRSGRLAGACELPPKVETIAPVTFQVAVVAPIQPRHHRNDCQHGQGRMNESQQSRHHNGNEYGHHWHSKPWCVCLEAEPLRMRDRPGESRAAGRALVATQNHRHEGFVLSGRFGYCTARFTIAFCSVSATQEAWRSECDGSSACARMFGVVQADCILAACCGAV